jgi:hypothetical protein
MEAQSPLRRPVARPIASGSTAIRLRKATTHCYWGLRGGTVNVTDASATEGGDTATFTVVPVSPPAGGTNMIDCHWHKRPVQLRADACHIHAVQLDDAADSDSYRDK